MAGRVVPTELQIEPDEGGIPGTVILFVDDGRLSYLEYVYYTGEVPITWPNPSQPSAHPVSRWPLVAEMLRRGVTVGTTASARHPDDGAVV